MGKHVVTVGIDVGAEELWVAVEGRKPRSFVHSRSGIQSLHRWTSKRARGTIVHYCLEATGVYSVHAASELTRQRQAQVSIVNPVIIVAYARAERKRSKTDQIDAEVIRRYAAERRLPVWRPEPESLRHLAALVAQGDAIKRLLLQWNNREHAQKYIRDLPTEVRRNQRATRRHLENALARIERAIDALCATDAELAQQTALLETIPGIGRRSATRLLAYGGTRWRRYTANAMTAQAGLAPRHHRSGSSVEKKQRIDKQGDRRLRKALYMPALVGSRHNPTLKKLYRRLCDNGKLKKVALTACMRKLLLIVRAVLTKKAPFNMAYPH